MSELFKVNKEYKGVFMGNKIKFFVIYLGMILLFFVRYYFTLQIKLYEMERIDEGVIWLWYMRNGIDVAYYISEFLLFLSIARMKSFKVVCEIVLFVIPGMVLLVTSTVMINPFVWTFSNSSYCIPFGAMLICAFFYRRYVHRKDLG